MGLSRKQSREIAYKLLFQLTSDIQCDVLNNESLEIVCGCEKPSGPELEYIQKLCAAAKNNLVVIDEIIKNHSKGFAFDRVFKTDLTALRMGIAEVKFFEGTPAVVAVNEAVEIAKKYGTEKSGSFVNGILATLLKT